ncbi:TetR/AcrR family transcriptional regulator [Actinoplanes sp. ATCC 53533]|uniref:TetR/AcrR family transcriptional regulator n=1 Tax=Actinoplanes sp. ATCC 53533 TaxID=1288362 RepID=UPI0010012E32|nr:TetR/AcrR family transcriptional regulator [Actinoplanes sp. ATCC 53533]RSM74208.1 TetR/AcrR family transcriptional regulator [Actinoplanes sp. ATCC 53533]
MSGVGRMAQARREALVCFAAAEFAGRGYEQASLNAIIRSAGMSKSSFYHFVGSKQALFELVISDGAERLVRALHIPAPEDLSDDFWPQITELIGRLAALGERQPQLGDVGRMFYLDDAPRQPGAALHGAWAVIDRWLAEAIAVGRRTGQIGDDLPAALQARLAVAVLQVMDQWSLRNDDQLTAHDRRQLGHAQLAAVRRLLGGAP